MRSRNRVRNGPAVYPIAPLDPLAFGPRGWAFGSIGRAAANAARFTLARFIDSDLASASGRAIVEERYASLRRQVPIIYLLGFVNLAGMEMATSGKLAPGANLPTFIALCGLMRLVQWYGSSGKPSHE